MERRLSQDSGVTLIELMFAAGVIALGLSMLFGSLVSINVMGEVSRDRAVAESTLASVLEDIRLQSFTDLQSYRLPFPLEEPGIAQGMAVRMNDEDGNPVWLPMSTVDGSVSAGSTPSFPNPVEVEVLFAWMDDSYRVYWVTSSTQVNR